MSRHIRARGAQSCSIRSVYVYIHAYVAVSQARSSPAFSGLDVCGGVQCSTWSGGVWRLACIIKNVYRNIWDGDEDGDEDDSSDRWQCQAEEWQPVELA